MNIIKAGVIMIVYFFVLFIAYMVISTPFEEMVSGFEDAGGSDVEGRVTAQAGLARSFFKISMGLMVVIPGMWFIIWIFSREPDWRIN